MKALARWAENDAVSQRGILLANSLDHETVIKIAELIGNHASGGSRKLNKLADLCVAVRDERGNRNAAHLLQSDVENHELSDVRQLDDDTIERTKSDLQEIERQVGGQAVEFGIGDRAVAVDQRNSVRVPVKNNSVFLRERLVDPIALLAVALGKLRRKWNDALQHDFPSPKGTATNFPDSREAWSDIQVVAE